MEHYDVCIVGGGAAGCALAARLSEDSTRQVLLLEAGPDYATRDAFPEELRGAAKQGAVFPGHPNNWSFVGRLTRARDYPIARGKIIGGSSSVNGTYFIRGRAEDFDGWATLGNNKWSFDQVLPYFIKLENDLDVNGALHGSDGPMPVRRAREADYRPVTRAFVNACRDAGYPEEADKNGLTAPGVGPIPRNSIDGVRMNTSFTHLETARGRPNFTVKGDVEVVRVCFQERRATGVEARVQGVLTRYSADEVVLCAGAIKSPQLLMLSGIGPAEELGRHGIALLQDSPGVGRNVVDHPYVPFLYNVDERENPASLPPDFHPLQACLNYTAPDSRFEGDMQISCAAVSVKAMLSGGRSVAGLPSYLTRPIATLKALAKLPAKMVLREALTQAELRFTCALLQEQSSGEITLRSSDPFQPPVIAMNYLSHPGDLPRLRHCVRLCAELLRSRHFSVLGAQRIAPTDPELASDAELDRWIHANLATFYHLSCSARMGPDSDGMAVVDQECRVRGVEGLRVVDLSICPSITRRGPYATAVMIGERASDFF